MPWTPVEDTSDRQRTKRISIDPDETIPKGNDQKTSTLAVLLPSRPVNVYVDGTLIKKQISNQFEFVTPQLTDNSVTYRLTVIDSGDSTKGKDFDIVGVTGGKIIPVDLRSLE